MTSTGRTIDRLDERQHTLLLSLLSTGVSRAELIGTLQSGTPQQWDDALRDFARTSSLGESSNAASRPRITRGSEVVLAGGTGKKRRHNGSLATVVSYPRPGGWMTVRVLPTAPRTLPAAVGVADAGAPPSVEIKWRKGGCRTAARSPLLCLDDDILAHIVGYLGHGAVENSSDDACGGLLWVLDAARIFSQIASVCRRLQRFAQEHLSYALGHVDANFDGLEEAQIIPCILWLCKCRLRLGRIKMRVLLADVPLMIQLLRNCDTEGVIYVQSLQTNYGSLKDSTENSILITMAWMARFGDANKVVNLIGREAYPEIGQLAADLGVPYNRDVCWKDLHDAIAKQCPNVSHLEISLKIPPDVASHEYWKRRHFSPALFALPSVRQLKLSCGFCVETMFPSRSEQQVDSCFIQAFIEKLEDLESLEVGFGCSFGMEHMNQRRFHIDCPSLRFLNVERFLKGMWVSCKCPKLERFICNGHFYGNGSRPDFTFEEMLAHQGDVMFAGPVEMIGMDIPSGCMCILKGFDEFLQFVTNRYQQSYRPFLGSVRNAHFWTHAGSTQDGSSNAD